MAWPIRSARSITRDAFASKYDTLSSVLAGDLLERILQLMERLQMTPPFRGRPLREANRIIQETLDSGSTRANPRLISRTDVEWMLERIFNDSSPHSQGSVPNENL